MKPLSPAAHGLIDYAWSAALPLLPRWMGWSPVATRLLTAAGLGALAYSLLTDYPLGAVRVLPMQGHLALDVANALALGAAPLWLDDEPEVKATLVGLALLALAVTAATETRPQQARLLPYRHRM